MIQYFSAQNLSRGLVCFLAAGLLIAFFAPRALSFFPALVGLALFVLYKAEQGIFPSIPVKALVAVIAALALMLLSALWSPDPAFVLERTGKLFGLCLGGFLLLAALTEGQQAGQAFKAAYLYSLLTGLALCLFDLLSGGIISLGLSGSEQIFNPSSLNPTTAILCIAYFPALGMIYWKQKDSKLYKWLLILAGFLLFALFLFTESQSVQLALVAGLFFYFLFPYKNRFIWYGLSAFIVFLMLSSPFIAQVLFSQALDHLNSIEWFQRGYAGNRLEIWDFVSRKALERPFTGHGLEATRLITDFECQNIYHKGDSVLHPHNFALQLWIEFGFIGVLMASAAFLFFMRWLGTQEVHLKRVTLSTFIAFLSVAATGYGLWQSWWVGSAFLLSAYVILSVQCCERDSA